MQLSLTTHVKKWSYIISLLLATLLPSSVFAVDNLYVSGATPDAINGTYVYVTTDANGNNYWKHSSATYYIYHETAHGYWDIGPDLGNIKTYTYTSTGQSSNTSPTGLTWNAATALTIVTSTTVVSSSPEIGIFGNGTEITDGNTGTGFSTYTNFGSVNVSSGTVTRTFTIKNTGLSALSVTGATITGTNAGDFTLTSLPTFPASVAASGTTTFEVTFNPSATGNRTATVTITNNDADEGTYDFSISGYGYNPTDLIVSGITTPTAANGVYTHQGVLNGQYEYWNHSSGSYYIYRGIDNNLNTVWFIDTDKDPTSYLYKQFTTPDPAPTSPQKVSSTNWANPAGSTLTSTINITDYVAAPEIGISGNSVDIVNNDNTPDTKDYTHFGAAYITSGTTPNSTTRIFTITNTGGTALNLTGASPYVSISGANASDFSVTTIPSSSITSGGSTTFQITFTPSAEGSRTASVTIGNNDSDEGTFQFAIAGNGIVNKNLLVSGLSTSAANGTYTFQGISNGFPYWTLTSSATTYYIYNSNYSGKQQWYLCTDLDLTKSTITIIAVTTTSVGNIKAYPVGISSSDWAATGTITIATTPSSITSAATPVTSIAATLNGTVNANDASTTVSFDYGPTTSYGTNVSASPATVTGTATSSVSYALSGLTPNTTYHYRVKAVNAVGTTYGGDLTFTTPAIAPTATTGTANTITSTSATLIGTVNANNASTTVTFDYGTTTSYGTNVTASPASVTGTAATSVSYALSNLTPNTTYHYRVNGQNTAGSTNGTDVPFTTSPAATSAWTGTGNWSTAGNWGSGLPSSITNATISSGTCTVDANTTVDNLTVSPGAALTINSGVTLTVTGTLTLQAGSSSIASLINNGAITAGTTYVQSYLTKNVWHVVSSPAASEQIGTFIDENKNYIQNKPSTVYYGVMNYNETSNTWNKGTSYFTTASTEQFGAGKGYGILPIAANDVTVSYKGALTNASINPSITRTSNSYGWNCIGNPYPASLNISESTGTTFISQNKDNSLDPSYACVYVWNSSSSTYQIIGTVPTGFSSLSQNSVAPGQGFFIKAKTGSGSVTITPAMQMHNTTLAVKATRAPWPAIRLKVANSTDSATTLFAFNSNMSKGLDPSFDAGLFRGSETIDLYSHLVKDNGVDFAIQCLPEAYDSLAIPLGIDYKAGGKLTFSAQSADLPADCKLILEDKTTGTFTSLANGATYSATVDANTTGTGRFFLHTSSTTTGNSNGTTAVGDLTAGESLKVYAVRKVIYINGSNLNGSMVKLHSITGRSYGSVKLTADNTATLDKSNLAAGVYVVSITTAEGKEKTFKVVLE